MPAPTAVLVIALFAAPASFDPAQSRPYFADGPAAAAARRFRVEDWAGAAKLFDAYLAAARAPDRAQAQFMAAYALSRAGRFLDAAKRFDALVKSYPLLADYHRLYASRAYLAAKKWAEAKQRAGEVAESSPLDGEARLARADALAGMGKHADAAAGYRAYLEKYPRSWREAETRARFAAEREAAGPAGWAEAREAWREVYIHFPTDAAAKRAEQKLRARDPQVLQLRGAERLARGLALFEQMRNPESEAELRAAVAAGDLDKHEACVAAYHLAQSVFKQRDRPRAAALFDDAAKACDKLAGDEAADLHMKSLYQAGRCHAARGEAQIAADLFAQAEAAHPSHSYADDARLRAAEAYDALAEKAKAAPVDGGAPPEAYREKERALLADLSDRYPTGDNRSEALFRLFFAASKAGQIADARKWLDAASHKIQREEGWWDAGRTLYWMGRVADREGKAEEARAAWTRCAREYPLSYYALQAMNRLRERAPDEERKLADALRAPAPSDEQLRWRFLPRPLFEEAGFRRGVELARLGLGAEAKRELAAVGIKPPEKGAAVAADAEELGWLAAVLYDRAGEYALSHWIPRHTLTAYSRAWPTGDNAKRWLISYPHGYADLVVDNTAKTGQPAALEFAVIREESAFDPLNESFANAIGLTQLTQAPAKRFSQGLPYTREALRDPAINVAIGARELGFLWSLYNGNAALTIAGYNAGEHRVAQWLKAAPAGQTLDEWIESIPFDETRGYTKRVLSSWFAYTWLYPSAGTDPVPPLAPALPKK